MNLKMGNIEQIHSFKYADAIKVAQRFTSKNTNRLVLQLINHKSNGDLIATDSHQLLFVKGVHGFKEDFLVNAKSLEFAKGEYPDHSKVFEADYKVEIKLNVHQISMWLEMFKSMNQMSKQKSVKNTIKMKLDEEISFELANHEVKFSLPYEEYKGDKSISSISFQAELMRNAFEDMEKLKSIQVTIHLSGQNAPILLDNGIDVKAILLPVRTC
jgi:hypothetical protein